MTSAPLDSPSLRRSATHLGHLRRRATRYNSQVDTVNGEIVTYGDTTPPPTFIVVGDDSYVQPGDDVTFTASYTNPSYIASAVYFDSTSTGILTASYNTMLDGSTADLMDHQSGGDDVCMGDVIHGTSRTHHWTAHWNTEGVKSWQVEARSDNAVDVMDSATVTVDGTLPGLPTNLGSSTHTVNVWDNDPTITYTWTAATDNLSGVDRYGTYVSTGGPGAPSNVKDIAGHLVDRSDARESAWHELTRTTASTRRPWCATWP